MFMSGFFPGLNQYKAMRIIMLGSRTHQCADSGIKIHDFLLLSPALYQHNYAASTDTNWHQLVFCKGNDAK